MDCEKTREELSAYIDGELGLSETETLERHLEACEGCRGELESLRATVGLVRSLPKASAPAALKRRVISAVSRRPSSSGFPGALTLLTAAALVLVAVVAIFILTEQPGSHKTVTTAQNESAVKPKPLADIESESTPEKHGFAEMNKAGRLKGEEAKPSEEQPSDTYGGTKDWSRTMEKSEAENADETKSGSPAPGIAGKASPTPPEAEPFAEEPAEREEYLPKEEMRKKIEEALRTDPEIQKLAKAPDPEKQLEGTTEAHRQEEKEPQADLLLVETRDIERAKEAIAKLVSEHRGVIETEKSDEVVEKKKAEKSESVEIVVKVGSKEYEEFIRQLGALEKLAMLPDTGEDSLTRRKTSRAPAENSEKWGRGGGGDAARPMGKSQSAAPPGKPAPSAPAAEGGERSYSDKDKPSQDAKEKEAEKDGDSSKENARPQEKQADSEKIIKIRIVLSDLSEDILMKIKRLSKESKASYGK